MMNTKQTYYLTKKVFTCKVNVSFLFVHFFPDFWLIEELLHCRLMQQKLARNLENEPHDGQDASTLQ